MFQKDGYVYLQRYQNSPRLLRWLDETVYEPGEAPPAQLTPWRQATPAHLGTWLELDDTGAARMLAWVEAPRPMIWTAVGCGMPSKEKHRDFINTQDLDLRQYRCYTQRHGMWAPKRIHDFVDALFALQDPLMAASLTLRSSGTVHRLRRDLPPALRAELSKLAPTARKIMGREDTQQLVAKRVRDMMEDRGLLDQAVKTLSLVLADDTVGAAVRVKAALAVLDQYRLDEPGSGRSWSLEKGADPERLRTIRQERHREPVALFAEGWSEPEGADVRVRGNGGP